MSTQLAKAAQAVIDRWDSPQWEWTKQGPTADLIADLRKELAAFEAAPQQAQAPGWQLVPVEPTPEMLQAGERAHKDKERDMFSPTPTEFYDECGGPIGYAWLAMLSAAPQQGSKT